MASPEKPSKDVTKVAALVCLDTTPEEKVALYDKWKDYDQDVVALEFKVPSHVADNISKYFTGDREAVVVLDLACGTGEVAKQMKKKGFNHFVGIDGSSNMLEGAKKTGLYRDLKQCILGKQDLPAQRESFDIVLISGGLAVDLISVNVVRQMCDACKPGGLVLLSCRHGPDNMEYTAALEREAKQMEDEGLWKCVAVTRVEKWLRSAIASGDYVPGSLYLYKKV